MTSGAPFGTAQSNPVDEIVEHEHALAGVDQRVHHVTADIAGAAGDQNRHAVAPCAKPCMTRPEFSACGNKFAGDGKARRIRESSAARLEALASV